MFNLKHVLEEPTTIMLTLGTIGAAATVKGVDEQKAAARDQKRAYEEQRKARQIQERMQKAKADRERRKQIQEAIRARSLATAAAAARGAQGSSAAVQAQDSITSQLASNVSFLDSMQSLTEQQSIFMGNAYDYSAQAASHSTSASVASAVGSLAFQGAAFAASPEGKEFGAKVKQKTSDLYSKGKSLFQS